MFINKKAFTLSEIIVTASIIAVIAALTIPTYLSSSQLRNNEYSNGLKKAYTSLLSAADEIKATNAGTFIGLYDVTNAITLHNNLRNKFSNSLKFTQLCDQTDLPKTNCWPTDYYQIDGSANGLDLSAYSMAVLNDGVLLVFHSYSDISNNMIACINNTVKDVTGLNNIGCGEIYADVNGFRKPNKFGRDIFRFYITQDKIIPEGEIGTPLAGKICPDNDGTQDGLECAAKVLKDGKMTY